MIGVALRLITVVSAIYAPLSNAQSESLLQESLAISRQVHKEELVGSWQRVYDTCGEWVPESIQDVFIRAREFVPYREVIVYFDKVSTHLIYEAYIAPSRACAENSLRTHREVDCMHGVNRGSVTLLDDGRSVLFNAIFEAQVSQVWGAIPARLKIQKFPGGIILTEPSGVGCLGLPWSIYLVPMIGS